MTHPIAAAIAVVCFSVMVGAVLGRLVGDDYDPAKLVLSCVGLVFVGALAIALFA